MLAAPLRNTFSHWISLLLLSGLLVSQISMSFKILVDSKDYLLDAPLSKPFSTCDDSCGRRGDLSKESQEYFNLLIHAWGAFQSSGRKEERLANFFRASHPRRWDDLVLVTHISPDKMNRIMTLIKWWNGPMSVGIYCNNLEHVALVTEEFLKNSNKLGNVTAHFLFEKNETLGYPHNKLRNLAMQNAEADYVFPIDADFVPSPMNAYERMTTMFKENPEIIDRMKKMEVFVVPVFEIFAKDQQSEKGIGFGSEKDLPMTRQKLIFDYYNNTARQWHWEPGHAASNYRNWLSLNETAVAKKLYYPITPKVYYEPYFIAHRPSLPNFFEGFRGYGKNKQSFVAECVLKGFKFNVLYQYWLSHLGHESNIDGERNKVNIQIWKSSFVKHLKSMYSVKSNREWLKA